MEELEERLRNIMESTKGLFLAGLREKAGEAAGWIGKYREGAIGGDELLEQLQRIAHSLKGVALIFGFKEVHLITEKVADLHRRHEHMPMNRAQTEELIETVLRLNTISEADQE